MMKKSLKSHSISLLTQKTFIYVAAAVFLVQVFGIVQTIVSAQSISVPIGNHVLNLTLSAGLLPLLVFTVAYWLNHAKTTKTVRLFTAALMAFMFVMLQAMTDLLLTKVIFRQQFGYGDQAAIWNAPWMQYIPSAIAIIAVLAIITYLFKKPQKTKQNSPPVPVQTNLVWVIAGSFVISSLVASWHTLIQNNNIADGNGVVAIAVMLMSVVPVGILYGIVFLLARRSLLPVTRAFIATTYTTVGVFIFVIGGSLASTMRLYEYSPIGIVPMLPIILSFIVYVSIVAIHKWRKVF